MAPFRVLVVVLAALLASACAATMREAAEGKAAGTAAVYPVAPERAWAIARNIVHHVSPVGVESNRERTMITCDAGTGTDTTYIAVWIEPGAGPAESVVTIRSVKKGALQIKSLLTEEEFHFEFRQRLEEK